jgi:uncharacterized tellurite resistance protein B-like protein
MDQDTRHRVCRLIAGIVVVDDDLDDAEDDFINRMLVRFGLSQDQRDDLFPIMDAKEAADEFAVLGADVQKEAFALLVEAAAADKKYADEERGYLHAVGKVAGIDPDEIDARVKAAMG